MLFSFPKEVLQQEDRNMKRWLFSLEPDNIVEIEKSREKKENIWRETVFPSVFYNVQEQSLYGRERLTKTIVPICLMESIDGKCPPASDEAQNDNQSQCVWCAYRRHHCEQSERHHDCHNR